MRHTQKHKFNFTIAQEEKSEDRQQPGPIYLATAGIGPKFHGKFQTNPNYEHVGVKKK